MSENNLFPRRSDIFKKSVLDVRDSVARPALDTLYQVTFSFGNFDKWLDLIPSSKRVQARDFQRKMSILCTQAEIPGTSFIKSTATGHHQGIVEVFPNLRNFPPLNLTFYCDADMVILEVLEKWMTYINPIKTNKRDYNAYTRFNYPEDYKEIIHVTKFERDSFLDEKFRFAEFRSDSQQNQELQQQFQRSYKSNMTSYEFVNIWPTDLTSMRVAYGDPNVLKCNVQFSYDRFFTKFDYKDSNQSVLNQPDNSVTEAERLFRENLERIRLGLPPINYF